MKNMKKLHEIIRNIISETWKDDGLPDEVDRSRVQRGSKEITFPVFLPDDQEVTVTANYDESSPFDIEIWKAVDETGNEIDVDELRGMVEDLDATAWDAVERHYHH